MSEKKYKKNYDCPTIYKCAFNNVVPSINKMNELDTFREKNQ